MVHAKAIAERLSFLALVSPSRLEQDDDSSLDVLGTR